MKKPPTQPKKSHHGASLIVACHPDQRLNPGSFGLQACGRVNLNPRRILGIKRALKQQTRKQGSVWLRAAAGRISHDGQVLFELQGMKSATALTAYQAIRNKLPMALTFARS